MTRKIGVIMLVAILITTTNCVKIDDIENVKQKSQIVTKDFIRAVEHLDSDRAAELFARSAETVLFDPVNDSLVIGSEQIKLALSNLLAQIDGIKIHLREAHVFPGADLTSSRIAAICDAKIHKKGAGKEFQVFASGYLKKTGSVWRFVQLQVACKEKVFPQNESTTKLSKAPSSPPAKKSVVADSVSQADSLKKAIGDTSGTSY